MLGWPQHARSRAEGAGASFWRAVYIPHPNTLRPAPGSWEVRDTSCSPGGCVLV